jgi:transposase
VEGANGLGRGIAQLLVAAGAQVVDVPAKLAARARLLGTSSARKTDLADACSVAAAAIHHRRLRSVASRTRPSSSGCCPTGVTTWSPSAPAR